MRAILPLLQVIGFAFAFALAGCVSAEDQANDYNTFHSDPEKQDDGHGWGVNVQQGGH